jgi:hypothetical protein
MQPVDAPVLMLQGFDEPVLFQVAQMLGNFDLRFAQNGLEVANTQWRLRQHVQEPQPGLVAKAFVYADQIHNPTIYLEGNILQ